MRCLESVDVDHRLSKGLWRLLWEIVSDAAADNSMFVFPGELLAVDIAVRVGRAIGIAFKGDCRNSDDRTRCQLVLERVVFRIALCDADPPAVVMYHDGNVVRIGERRCGAIERGIIEAPLRRGDLPD